MRRSGSGLARALSLALGPALALVCGQGRAAEYSMESSAEANVGYTEDINVGGGSGGSGGTTDSPTQTSVVKMKLGVRTPSLNVSADTLVNYTVYTADTRLNSDNQYLTLNGNYREDLTTYGLTGSYARTTTLTTGFQETGRQIQQNSRQQFLSVAPSWQRQITPLDSVSFSPSYRNVNQSSQNRPDSETYGGTSTWSRFLDPATTGFVTANSQFYNSNSNGSLESLSVGGSLGVSHQFTPTLSASLSAGPVWVKQRSRLKSDQGGLFDISNSQLNSDNSSIGYQINSALSYQMSERTGFSGSIIRNISPNTTSGVVQETTSLSLGVNHSLLRQVSVAFRGYFAHSEDVADGGSSRTRDYAEAAPSIQWMAREDLRLALTYRFRWQYFEDDNENGNGSAVFASLIYDLPRVAVSR